VPLREEGKGTIGIGLGYPGLEPETSPLSGARSTTELIARVSELEEYPYRILHVILGFMQAPLP